MYPYRGSRVKKQERRMAKLSTDASIKHPSIGRYDKNTGPLMMRLAEADGI